GLRRRRRLAVTRLALQFAESEPVDEPKVDPPCLEIDARDLHIELVGEPIALARALAAQLVRDLVVLEVLAAELRDVYEPFDVQLYERDEDTERRHAGDASDEDLADALAHVHALQPCLD